MRDQYEGVLSQTVYLYWLIDKLRAYARYDGLTMPVYKVKISMAMIIVLKQGAVTLSSAGVISVCSGDQLELTCMITGNFAILLWNVTLITENTATHINFTRVISSSSPTDQTFHMMINSTNFTGSRISAQNSYPLTSRLLINPVSNHLNGTEVSCVNSLTSELSSVAVISISSEYVIQGALAVQIMD